ncbi:hypothetical protein L6452_17840 [Arctium lappa]|uniref:Uncharacterized protein n=1 Tax=Arctium lappa TaxID=4217 RepID=A0ACB9C4I4_ARCLA|nr:hypothetical protein L6452_17840 [Arctium lappa]
MRVIFNGKECALPKRLPKKNGSYQLTGVGILSSVLVTFLTFLVVAGRGRHRRNREASPEEGGLGKREAWERRRHGWFRDESSRRKGLGFTNEKREKLRVDLL